MDPQAFQLLMDRFDSVDDELKEIKAAFNSQELRISSLEDTRSRQRGIMIGGGMVVTFCASMFTWVVDHFWRAN